MNAPQWMIEGNAPVRAARPAPVEDIQGGANGKSGRAGRPILAQYRGGDGRPGAPMWLPKEKAGVWWM